MSYLFVENCPSVRYSSIGIRLLHPKRLDRIWIGQNQYRLPLAPLNEYPEPWRLKVADRKSRALASLEGRKKNGVPDMGGGNW